VNFAATSLYDIRHAVRAGDVRIKPSLKKIDLGCLVGSDIDLESKGMCEPDWTLYGPEVCGVDFLDREFRPRFNHWHHHTGGECPIPEGFIIEVKFPISEAVGPNGYLRECWIRQPMSIKDSIIAYRITGIAEGYEL